jgi:NAD(P)-dependent dehydrogenase (short-subunit alcohol dehydrogenase family)
MCNVNYTLYLLYWFYDKIDISDVDREKILTSIPLRRFGLDEELAGLVRYLAIDKSAAYITGYCFSIDGGLGIGST